MCSLVAPLAPLAPLGLLACALSCLPPAAPPEREGAAPDAPDAGVSGACDDNQLPLIIEGEGEGERYFVAVTKDGEAGVLQLDTGSGLTFLFTGAGAPDFEPYVADLTIGCETLPTAGRGFAERGTVAGLPVLGLLGMDFLLGAPSVLDVEQRTLTRHTTFPAALTTDAFSVAFDNVQSHALVPVRLDDVAVRLMFDTGGNTLLVGAEGAPGDEEVFVEDFEGNIFPVYIGSGQLAFDNTAPRDVTVLRAPEFPYFEDTVTALGGNLHGLLGVSAFAGERLLFEGEASRFWVLPQ